MRRANPGFQFYLYLADTCREAIKTTLEAKNHKNGTNYENTSRVGIINRMKQLKIRLLKQAGINNCWAASLSMALQVFGIEETESELDQKFKANQQGLNLDQVWKDFPKQFPNIQCDFRSEIFTGVSPILSFDEIKTSIDNQAPILIGVNNYDGHKAHALLIFGYDESNKKVLIADPWKGNSKSVDYPELKKLIWTETLILSSDTRSQK
jgi:ABC-type bacteriocin/lantibiotic exporter with double-glycine peptidase domain